MANDCLVKRLKGVVNNSDLPIYGTIKLHFNSANASVEASSRYTVFQLIPEHTCKIKTTGNGTFSVLRGDQTTYLAENVSSFEVPYISEDNGWFTIVPNDGEYDILVGCKYNAIRISTQPCISVDVKDLDYISNIVTCNYTTSAHNVFGTYSPQPQIKEINIVNTDPTAGNYSGLNINVEALKLCSEINSLQIKGVVDVQFNINEVLNNKILLTVADIALILGITGDVKTLAEQQVATGRESGSLKISGYKTQMTFDGTPIIDYIRSQGGTWDIQINFDSSATSGYTVTFPA